MKELIWQENGEIKHAAWLSENQMQLPKQVVLLDDTCKADVAYRLATEGIGMLWRGDFQNARQLLNALTRRLDKIKIKPAGSIFEAFHKHRQSQIHRARILGLILIELDGKYISHLRRAPDVREACEQVYGIGTQNSVISLRELQGLIGAYEWHKKGVFITALDDVINPNYGVFSPVRGEYIELVAQAELPKNVRVAFDIGVGSGVLSAVLAKRGVKRIIATDQDVRALNCAKANLSRMGLGQVELQKVDLFPINTEKAQLIVCNPPWLPVKVNAAIERAVYDPNSQMLKGFLKGVAAHLSDDGQAWLILSDLAEHLMLRSRKELLDWIAAADLQVMKRVDVRPRHKKVFDITDPLHVARKKEVTSLWCLQKIAKQ